MERNFWKCFGFVNGSETRKDGSVYFCVLKNDNGEKDFLELNLLNLSQDLEIWDDPEYVELEQETIVQKITHDDIRSAEVLAMGVIDDIHYYQPEYEYDYVLRRSTKKENKYAEYICYKQIYGVKYRVKLVDGTTYIFTCSNDLSNRVEDVIF